MSNAPVSDLGVPPNLAMPLGVLWGKSKAGEGPNLLIQHLLDTAAVAELMWDHYLAPAFRRRVDDIAQGQGRRFFSWLCAMHDVGKATPAFQYQVEDLGQAVAAAGLERGPLPPHASRAWRHDLAGARILHDTLQEAGWSSDSVGWIWPLVAGHHGIFWARSKLNVARDRPHLHGRGPVWRAVQQGLVQVVSRALGVEELAAMEPAGRPSRADQLALSGWIVMADWIASDEHRFGGIDCLPDVGLAIARDRASRAWKVMGIRGGWGERLPVPTGDLLQERFRLPARPSQVQVVEAAREVPAPALIIVEAPMGEGKTEAAMAAAEVLAARFGADGLFIGMPTQATSDPMFSRVLRWSREVADGLGLLDGLPVALLHGKRMFNEEWRDLLRRPAPRAAPSARDKYGVPEDLLSVANVDEGGDHDESGGNVAPAEWFLGRKRGLLSPLVVGTIDQLLFAATRTKHVMLRFAGLGAKIVVLDEIHAADVYMLQFVDEALRWLGQGSVPVVLLSATLAPDQRREMVASYLQGALGDSHFQADDLPSADGYPCVTAAWADGEQPGYRVTSSAGWRASRDVAVEVLEETSDDPAGVVHRLGDDLETGGCALVIRNTVRRAQDTYRALRERFSEDVVLLHGRLAVGTRADRTERVLSRLGPPSRDVERPRRLIVVATQLAEQSFDVDVDLLVTDLAPIDLLLQRAGRLHRHDRDATERPVRLRTPRVVVTGASGLETATPKFPGGSEYVYSRYHLLRAAALVMQAVDAGGWSIPQDVPRLVGLGYGKGALVPQSWADEERKARDELDQKETKRKARAELHVLVARDEWSKPTLEGLHRLGQRASKSDDEMHAVVRDGKPTVEIVLLRRSQAGYAALDGTRLGIHGEAGTDHIQAVLAGTVRLPARLSASATALTTLPEWKDRPWLRFCRVVEIDAAGRGHLGDVPILYDDDLGLVDAGAGAAPSGEAGTT